FCQGSMTEKTTIILPSETWAREFDAKLLLACCLAERGYPVFVGCKNTIHLNITSFPTGLYLAKDFRVSSDTMFDILKKLGHTIMAWDEEATLPFDTKEYHTIRISPPSFEKVSAFFAWGSENQFALETAPCGVSAPIHLTGNPRGDLMRPELRSYFEKETAALKEEYGDIILINSNFGRMNHFLEMERIAPDDEDPALRGRPTSPLFVRKGMHKAKLFGFFLELVPILAEKFPEKSIIIRPHPSESFEAWQAAGKGFDNVAVVHKGHVHPWLLASDVMIHSGCTTGMEGYLLNKPVLGYQPIEFEEGWENLPNQLSHNVTDVDELIENIQEYSSGAAHARRRDELDALIEPVMSSMFGQLASDRIADKIEMHWRSGDLQQRQRTLARTLGTVKAHLRKAKKHIDYKNPRHKSSLAYDRHRFPEMELSEVRDRIGRLQRILGRFEGLDVASFASSGRIFKIVPAST
ncbi:MAG: surface carbohydrate biosynthesis protein, partial [Pseudomonadota bacterium]